MRGDGSHPAAWRAAAEPPAELFTPRRIIDRVRALEETGLSYLSFSDATGDAGSADVIGGLDPIEAAAFAAAVTNRIGLVASANTIHAEPYHLSNQLSSLDWAARGRAGWLARVHENENIAAEYGVEPIIDPAALRREADEVVRVVRRLWDTWEDDVFIADEAAARFLDLERLHYADFQGEFFSIKGPALVPRPPQGQPVVLGERRTLCPGSVDVVVVRGTTVAEIAAAAAAERSRGAGAVVADVAVVLDTHTASAEHRLAALNAHAHWAEEETVVLVAGAPGLLVGLLRELAGIVDGVRLHPAVLDIDAPLIGSAVIPELTVDGFFIAPSGEHLRAVFGLPEAENVFARHRLTASV